MMSRPLSRADEISSSPKEKAADITRAARRGMLGALLAVVALLVSAPLAHAATGSLSGTVTDRNGVPLANIAVQAQGAEFASTTTDLTGKYNFAALLEGEYRVHFAAFELRYIPQYYKEVALFSEATLVKVKEGEPKTGIDAKLHERGKISGTVKDTSGHPIGGVFVNVTPISGSEEFFGESPTTNGNGEYTITGLPAGSYKVRFSAFGLNFVSQYYNEQLSFSAATPVPIKEDENRVINPVLQVGGIISGTVTDAATHKPLGNVFISATDTRGADFFGGFAETNTNGEYTMLGLASGSYNLEYENFSETEAESEYLAQTVNGIGATQGSTTSGVNVGLVPKKPTNTSAPGLSGTPMVGQTLTCSNGTWTGIATLAYAYKWLRDGGPIAGPTGGTYAVQAADQGHGLSCEVTATNPKGHASATSNTLKVAPAIVLPPRPTLTAARLTNKRFRVSKRATAVSAKMAPLGTSFLFTLSTPSRVQIALSRSARGLRRGKSCLAPSAKLRRKHAKRCTRTLRVGTLTRSSLLPGADRVAFSGRIGKKPLQPGSYKALLTASNSSGLSTPAVLTLVIVR
jgi:hypothetical protein